jgi:hypothetical protein
MLKKLCVAERCRLAIILQSCRLLEEIKYNCYNIFDAERKPFVKTGSNVMLFTSILLPPFNV